MLFLTADVFGRKASYILAFDGLICIDAVRIGFVLVGFLVCIFYLILAFDSGDFLPFFAACGFSVYVIAAYL